MRKRCLRVGQIVRGTKLRVLKHLESDSHGNQRVLVRCEWIVDGDRCGVEKPMRVTDMTRKPYVDKNGKARLPHRSCGCQSRRAYREYWERCANAIPAGVRAGIFLRIQRDKASFEAVKAERHLPLKIITTIYRLELQRMRPQVERWVAENLASGNTIGVKEWGQFLRDAQNDHYLMVKRQVRNARRRRRYAARRSARRRY